jgi:NTP pyrophosphatase (non-canonical NTP hydrolase)
MEQINWNELRDRAYKIAKEHGFHEGKESTETALMLVITELAEAVEADRKNHHADLEYFNDCNLKLDNAFYYRFSTYIKDSVEDELADTAIRLLDLAGANKIDLSDRFIIAYIVNKKKPFVENCYKIVKDICNYKYTLEEMINYELRQIYKLASFYNINLVWHIEQKMRFNELRKYKHGKEY